MDAWRLHALDAFPDLRDVLRDPTYTLYALFFDLLPMVRDAHSIHDEPRLAAIYRFAEWCAAQPDKELWNPAGVAFYEHLFDRPEPSIDEVLPWLSERVRSDCRSLWEWRLPPEKFADLDRRLSRRKPPP